MVKAGDVVKVRVVEVDIPRKRIGLSMRREAEAGGGRPARREERGRQDTPRLNKGGTDKPASQGAFGAALAEAFRKR